MSQILYFDCASGISGDMTVASLLDLVGSHVGLEKMLASLELTGFHLHFNRVNSYGISAEDFDVHLEELSEHQHADFQLEEHHHHHHHDHLEQHSTEHIEHHHHHIHRNIVDIEAIIEKAKMSEKAKILAKKIFRIVAEAESKVHGKPINEVHFHEVGALDSIVDILSVAYLIDALGIEKIAFSALSEGSGSVMCQHGELSVPVPAVTEIASTYEIPLKLTDNHGEMVTPTGIAIVAALTNTKRPKECLIKKIGIGAGKRDFGRANILRAFILEETKDNKTEQVHLIESSIDDASGECLGLAMDEIFKAGALDVQYLPCFMKKNRPAWILRVLVQEKHFTAVEEAIFKHTTTIGLCKRVVERSCMERTIKTVQLPYGEVVIKECSWNGTIKRYPEYESVKALADKTGLSFIEIYETAKKL